MIVHDFDVRRSLAGPPEADPVPLVNPDAVLASAVSHERLQAVPRRDPKLFQAFHGIELIKFPSRYGPKFMREGPGWGQACACAICHRSESGRPVGVMNRFRSVHIKTEGIRECLTAPYAWKATTLDLC